MEFLYDKLKEYASEGYYPFHMPGHKRGGENFGNPFDMDITEIDGFDNLHHAEGILMEARKRAQRVYGSRDTYFLVNGSTSGILSAVSACTKMRGKILIARNCHKAVYHSILLRELETFFVYPDYEEKTGMNGGVNPQDIREMLEKHPDIQAVLITSPTYDGVVSDVKKIAEISHNYGKPLIVDEAHGAHFGFHPQFPESSVHKGADVVIHSLHKTLWAFTQSALIHVNGNLIDPNEVEKYLGIYQTSSPSYLLMAGMDQCIRRLIEEGEAPFQRLHENLTCFRNQMRELSHIKAPGKEMTGRLHIADFDQSKMILMAEDGGALGGWIYDTLLEKYKIQLEMKAGNYALALAAVGDRREGFDRLFEALKEMDKQAGYLLKGKEHVLKQRMDRQKAGDFKPETILKLSEADRAAKITVPLIEGTGRVSGEFVYLYPPGIPLLVPGEKISRDFVESILQYKENGFSIQGMKDYHMNRIEVLA